MEISKFRIAAIVLTLVAVALTAYSMSFPWYRISRTGDLSAYEDISHNAGTYDFYWDACIWTSPLGNTAVFVIDSGGIGPNPVSITFRIELVLTIVWVILGMLFLLSMLFDDQMMRVGSGIAVGFVSILTVAYFVQTIDASLRESRWFGEFSDGFVERGFVGSNDVWSWGPLSGWYMVLFALGLQMPAILLNFYALRHDP